jgi:glycine cleavage system aminomethyltransferase T
VPLLGSECSTVEQPPFFGRDEAELRRRAARAVDTAEHAFDMATMRLTVDGRDVEDLSAYRAAPPRFTLWLPEVNLLGATRRIAESVADGYQVMLRPLPAGEHVVAIAISGPVAVTITYLLTVVSAAYVDASASPVLSPAT